MRIALSPEIHFLLERARGPGVPNTGILRTGIAERLGPDSYICFWQPDLGLLPDLAEDTGGDQDVEELSSGEHQSMWRCRAHNLAGSLSGED